MSKPKATPIPDLPNVIVEIEPAPTLAEIEAELAGLDASLTADRAVLASLEAEHGRAMTATDAEAAEAKIADVQGRMRRRGHERADLVARRDGAVQAERQAARDPHLAELRRLADEALPDALAAYRAAITELVASARVVADALGAIGRAARAGEHRRAAELAHPSADELVGGAGGRPELVHAVIGELFRAVDPDVLNTRRLFTVEALDRVCVAVQTIARDGGTS